MSLEYKVHITCDYCGYSEVLQNKNIHLSYSETFKAGWRTFIRKGKSMRMHGCKKCVEEGKIQDTLHMGKANFRAGG